MKDQALAEPPLDADSITDDTDSIQLEDMEKPIDVWRAYFATEMDRANRLNDSDRSWEDVEVPSLTKLSEINTAYRTPKKLKVGTLLKALADTIPIGIGKAERIELVKDHMMASAGPERELAQDAALRTVLAKWNKVCAGVDLFNAEFEKLGQGEERSPGSISTTVMKIHEAIRDTDARAYLLAARIGRDDTAASGEGTESVWDSIRRLCNVIEEVLQLAESGVTNLPELQQQSERSLEKLSNLSKNLIGLKAYMIDSIAQIQRKRVSLEGGGGATSHRNSIVLRID
jgi:hypothetical protein